MTLIGQKYQAGDIFISAMMISANAMAKVLEHFKERFILKAVKKGSVAIGTVKGDMHDIGKNPALMKIRTVILAKGFPNIPGVTYSGLINRVPMLAFATLPATPIAGKEYTVLVPKVDADGNDLAGIRPVAIAVPVGAYMGWNLRAKGFAEGEQCDLAGSYIPFAQTNAMIIKSFRFPSQYGETVEVGVFFNCDLEYGSSSVSQFF